MGGLMESDDRCKFHKDILEKSGAPLPPIAQSKFLQEKETIFDYYIDGNKRLEDLVTSRMESSKKNCVLTVAHPHK
jgi:hypothetical protein